MSAIVDWSDRELIQRMLANDCPAWRVFAQRHDGLIYAAIDRVLRAFPNYRGPAEREDIRATLLSSLLAREMHKLRVFEFDRGVRLSSWIGLLATNAARDYVRAASRRPTATLAKMEALEDCGASPLANLLTKEAADRVLATLDRLSPRDRQLVHLLLLQEQPPEQVAAAMNISVKTVYTKKHKLVQRLTEVLERDKPRTRRTAQLARPKPTVRVVRKLAVAFGHAGEPARRAPSRVRTLSVA
jgi:RNA polymerase sigma-70 factor, ECF subfamily